MKRCPCCSARVREQSDCSRCQADLTALIATEKNAYNQLANAIELWSSNHIEASISALNQSLSFKKTADAIAFKGFIIQQKNKAILNLLAKQQPLLAKQQLYQLRQLFPDNQTLQQINQFTDYLLLKST